MYLNGFDDVEDIVSNFKGTSAQDLANATVLFASYSYENYSGKAFVLYVKDNKMYEVYGSHCSCNGLEEQWSPEETDKDALEYRFFRDNADFPDVCENDEDKEALQHAVLDEIAEQILLLEVH